MTRELRNLGFEGRKILDGKMRRKTTRSTSFKGQGPYKHSHRMFSMHLTFSAGCQAEFALPAIRFQKLESESQATPQGWDRSQKASFWLQASSFITYLLILYSLSMVQKPPLIINRNEEATRGNQSQGTAASQITPGSIKADTEARAGKIGC